MSSAENTLEPFSAPPSRCRMCESDSIHTRFMETYAGCSKPGCKEHPPLPERLEHRCNRCFFSWMTETAEKAAF